MTKQVEERLTNTRTSDSVYYNGNNDWIDATYLRKLVCKEKYFIEVEKGEVLASPGSRIDACFYIEHGFVIVYEVDQNDKRRIFDLIEPGMLLFSDFILFDRTSSFYYEAGETLRLYSLDMVKARKLMQKDKRFNEAVLAKTLRDFLVAQDLVRKTTTHTAMWRVSDFLAIFARRTGKPKPDGSTVIDIRVNQKQIADMLFINRITCLKCVHQLEDAGYISISSGKYEVKDIARLEEFRDTCE